MRFPLLFSMLLGALAAPSLPGAEPNPLPEKTPPTLSDVAYGPHERNRLDFYRAASDRPTPVVVYLHGGAWSGGDKRDIAKTDFEQYLRAGISVVSLNYRYVRQARAEGLQPPVRGPMYDAARAVQFVRTKAAEWNLDPRHVGLSGTSAGACTSLWLAYHPDLADPASPEALAHESTRIQAVAVDVAQTSLDPAQMKEWVPNSRYGQHAFGLPDGRDTAGHEAAFHDFLVRREEVLPWIREYSPWHQATADDPPTFLIYRAPAAMGQPQKDPTHSANFGVKLREKLEGLGVPCELVYPHLAPGPHAGMEPFLIEKLKP